ncbi:MAG: restriction endonuclease [Caldilineaceae bacterium]|nr:restriction endonuclease [Caldilineaceae bacterium]
MTLSPLAQIRRHTLVEYQPLYLPAAALDERSAALLWQRYHAQVEVEPPSFRTGDQWRLTAQGWAGFIPLMRNLALVLQPKVALRDLFAVIEVAYDLASLHFLPGLIQVTSLPDIYTRLARLLAQRIMQREQRGLYRAYLPMHENAPYVRGRIRTAEIAYTLPAATIACSYHQLTADIEENRILAWTLHLILRSGICTGETLTLIQRAYRLLASQVTLTPIAANASRGRVYTRLNQDYAPLHALCAFFLDQSGPGHTLGDQNMVPFLVDMARLYEKFVAAWLQRRLAASHRVAAQVHTPLSGDLHFTIDLVITAGRQRWVIDTKYKLPAAGPDTADVAQILAYAQVQGAQEAVLVYPAPIAQPLDVTVGGVRLRTLTFALDHDLDAAGEALVTALLETS